MVHYEYSIIMSIYDISLLLLLFLIKVIAPVYEYGY